MNSATISIHGVSATLESSGQWRHPNAGIERALNDEFSPGNTSPAMGDPFAVAAAMAAKEFRGEVLLLDLGEPPPAGVIH